MLIQRDGDVARRVRGAAWKRCTSASIYCDHRNACIARDLVIDPTQRQVAVCEVSFPILATGQGYHMAAPLLVQTAQQFTARGIAVYRFNWAFYSKDPREGRPAPDFSTEFEDMTAVLDRVHGDTHIDRAKIIAAGKSI